MSIFQYEDPDTGITWELNYIVTQGDEGPEYVEYREMSPDKLAAATNWQRLPNWAMPPEEAIEFWHGLTRHRCGVIVAMNPSDLNALCMDNDGLYFADLTLFSNVSHPDGDQVSPGMVVEVEREATRPIKNPDDIVDWLRP
jgi:hypothetical protein